MNPIISIVNDSETVTDADLKRKLLALQKQITRDFEPVWGWGANLRFNAKKFDMQVIVKDTASEGGFLGFHIKDGKPITYIFAKDDIADSGEYTSTLSHELLEMIADPNVNLYAIGKFRLDGKRRAGSSLWKSAIRSNRTSTRLAALLSQTGCGRNGSSKTIRRAR